MYQDDGRAGPKQFAAMRDGGAVIGFDIVAYLTGLPGPSPTVYDEVHAE